MNAVTEFRAHEAERQSQLAHQMGFTPIDNNDPAFKMASHVNILVYLVDGRFDLIGGVTPVYRRPVRYKGKWCVRNHGRVPLIGKIAGGYVT